MISRGFEEESDLSEFCSRRSTLELSCYFLFYLDTPDELVYNFT